MRTSSGEAAEFSRFLGSITERLKGINIETAMPASKIILINN